MLTFDHVNWKSIGVIYSLGASTVSSLTTQAKRSKDIDQIHFFKGGIIKDFALYYSYFIVYHMVLEI